MKTRHISERADRGIVVVSPAGMRRGAAAALVVALAFALSCSSAPKYRPGGRGTPPGETAPATPAAAGDSTQELLVSLSPPVRGWRCERIVSGFGYRPGSGRPHEGVDIDTERGEAVYAACAGRVRFAGRRRGYGTAVIIDHQGEVSTLYAHLSYLTVRAGQGVSSGKMIGRAGKRGRASGVHLHFELRRQGRAIDPSPHLCLDSAPRSP